MSCMFFIITSISRAPYLRDQPLIGLYIHHNKTYMQSHKSLKEKVIKSCMTNVFLGAIKWIDICPTVGVLVLYSSMLHNNPARQHMEVLWYPEVEHIYLPLLSDCTNPETLEAAVGAVQNLAACHWPVTLVPSFQRVCHPQTVDDMDSVELFQ